MPVETFVMGAEGWTPVGLKGNRDDGRMIPIGPIHAAQPTAGTTVCTGVPVEVDRDSRSFTPWGAGTCPACSEALAPQAAPTPPEWAGRAEAAGATGPDGPTVDEAAEQASDAAEADRPIGDARPPRTGPDGEPLGGDGS